MAVREGILTLLAEEPKYGYQIKREFEKATGDAWTLNVGQVYTTLRRLERDGLVVTEPGGADDQQRYRLTASGSSEVQAWMTTPVDQGAASRDALSIKILLAVESSVANPADVIGVQRSATMSTLQDLQHLRSDADATDLAWLLQLDRLVFHSEAELRWLDRIEDRLEGRALREDAGRQRHVAPSVARSAANEAEVTS